MLSTQMMDTDGLEVFSDFSHENHSFYFCHHRYTCSIFDLRHSISFLSSLH